jgi:hypothetical protein
MLLRRDNTIRSFDNRKKTWKMMIMKTTMRKMMWYRFLEITDQMMSGND